MKQYGEMNGTWGMWWTEKRRVPKLKATVLGPPGAKVSRDDKTCA